MKRFIIPAVFILGFVGGFLYTLPTKTIAGYFLTKNGIYYKGIEGGSFNIKISQLSYGNMVFPEVYLSISPFKILCSLEDGSKVEFNPLLNTGKLVFEDLNLDIYQKKREFSGIVSGKLDFSLEEGFFVGDGNLRVYLNRLKGLNIGNLDIDARFKPAKNHTDLVATIKGSTVNGSFKGKLKINIKSFNTGVIEGRFKGRFLGRNMDKNIKFSFDQI